MLDNDLAVNIGSLGGVSSVQKLVPLIQIFI